MAIFGDDDPVFVWIFHCTKHMFGSERSHLHCWNFQGKGNELDPDGRNTDVFFFDGASKVEKSGQILCPNFPYDIYLSLWWACPVPLFQQPKNFNPILVRIVFNLIFLLVGKLIQIQSLVLRACMLYDVFGSCANQGIHAWFTTHISAINNGKMMGLLRGAGTRFATCFDALHCLLLQKKALLVTICSPYFVTLVHIAKTFLDVQDIKSNQFVVQYLMQLIIES